MNPIPRIAVLLGGVSSEREVSLGSGEAAARALGKTFPVDCLDIVSTEALPAELDPGRHVVFSTLHGTFGEDGQMQTLLEKAGVIYAGCDAASSALTFDKVAAKRAMAEAGVPVLPHAIREAGDAVNAEAIVDALGEAVVIKPVASGSSVGLAFAHGAKEIEAAMRVRAEGRWLIEPRIEGREGTIGMLGEQALAIVEILPRSGVFDYASKYTKGRTEYRAPAEFDEPFADQLRRWATEAFRACGCRDFARIDFMVSRSGKPYFLEINTLPGLKETSLLPMSAAACDYDFEQLVQKLVAPALLRYKQKYSVC